MAERSYKLGFVLIHGAGLGPWIWRDLTLHPNAPALPVEFPRGAADGRPTESLQDYASHVLRQIEAWNCERLGEGR
jgi:hypothetical protein